MGLGGLGHMAVKLAASFGAEVKGDVKYRFVIDCAGF
jgi:hypothetical protein